MNETINNKVALNTELGTQDCSCGSEPGEDHSNSCTIERCPFCYGQLMSCDCIYEKLGPIYGWEHKPMLVLQAGVSAIPEGYELQAEWPEGRHMYCYPNSGLPEDIYNEGPTDEMWDKFTEMVKEEAGGWLPWTGYWPGVVEAESLDMWTYFGPDHGEDGVGWVTCSKDHPYATADLNGFAEQYKYDYKTKIFTQRSAS